MCIACRAASGHSQPEEVAEFFFSKNKSQVEAAKYKEPPSNILPPSTRLMTKDDGASNLQGFFHPRCPFYKEGSKMHKICLEDNIKSIVELLHHLKLHSVALIYCVRCYHTFDDCDERDSHQGKCRATFPIGSKGRSIDSCQIALLRLVDMRLAQIGINEAARLNRIASELVRVGRCATHRMQSLGQECFGYDFTWDDRGDNIGCCDDFKSDVDDFNPDVYLRTGIGFWMSVFHDLWELYFRSTMPPAVARKLLSLIEAHLDKQAHLQPE